jgi:hypothetical protein
LLSFLGPSVGFSLRVVSCVGAALGRFKPQAVRRSSSIPTHKPIMISGSRRGNKIDPRQQTTRSVRDIIDAPSSASAAFGGLILPDPGKTKLQFYGRTEFLIRRRCYDIGMRGTVEHLRETGCLDGFDRSTGHDLPSVSADRELRLAPRPCRKMVSVSPHASCVFRRRAGEPPPSDRVRRQAPE